MNLSRQRSGFVLEVNPRQFLVASLTNWGERPLEIDEVAEFNREDRPGLQAWLRERAEGNFATVFCSFYPAAHLLSRDSVPARRLGEPDFLSNLVKEKLFINAPAEWHIHLLDPMEGEAVTPDGPHRPVLFSCTPHAAVREMQQQLLDFRLMPERLEIGTLPLIAALALHKGALNVSRGTFIIELDRDRTRVEILGKEGVHTPAPLRLGSDAIAQAAMKEFQLPDLAAARERLSEVPADLAQTGRRLVRTLAAELRPIVYSYEMTTGQRIGECYCAFLSSETFWINAVLAESLDLEPLTLDLNQWHLGVGLRARPGLRLSPNWLGLVSLIAELTPLPSNVR